MSREIAKEFLAKSTESLSGAVREFAAGAYNNAANRCYYAAFQAALSLLLEVRLVGQRDIRKSTHQLVRGKFANEIVKRRKLLPSVDPSDIDELASIRDQADYVPAPVGKQKAARAVKLSSVIVQETVTYLGTKA